MTKERFQGYRGKSDMSLKLHFQSFSTERDVQETGGRGVMGVLVFPTYKSRQFPSGFIPNQPFSHHRCTITLSVILKYITGNSIYATGL